MKSVSGVTVTTPSTSVTVPPARPVVSMAVTTSAPPSRSASVSLAAGSKVIGVFCGVLGASATATGAKSSSVTVPVAVEATGSTVSVTLSPTPVRTTVTALSPSARSSLSTLTESVARPLRKVTDSDCSSPPSTV